MEVLIFKCVFFNEGFQNTRRFECVLIVKMSVEYDSDFNFTPTVCGVRPYRITQKSKNEKWLYLFFGTPYVYSVN